MKTTHDDITAGGLLKLKRRQMLVTNSEYRRGAVWTAAQNKKLVDSVRRGYPIPLIYFHHIRDEAEGLVSQRFEIIDGQQRINALSDFHEGAFKLFDPAKDESARCPDFVKKQACPWGSRDFGQLTQELRDKFLNTPLRIAKIETHDSNEARDLFVRLQSGEPLTSQEKRDAWPGQFTDFVLKLAGKPGIARYPGHGFFNMLMRAQKVQDRGKFRQLVAQIAMLLITRRTHASFCDINAEAIDDFYYEHLGFDASATDAKRLSEILDKVTMLLSDQKRSKIVGHEAIHLILMMDLLLEDYTRSWEMNFARAFDTFRDNMAKAAHTRDHAQPSEYWLRYGVGTRVNSDRADTIQRRHEFFAAKMYEVLNPQLKDPQRLFGTVERELIYYRDRKRCGVCDADVVWLEAEFHHVEQHSKGGQTVLENGALVHRHCHPKGQTATEAFAKKWQKRSSPYVP